jgi:Xaa-Pro dipeptidase
MLVKKSTKDILAGKYPAKGHAKRVVEYIKKKGGSPNGIIYLEGQKTHMIEDNDSEAPFRQRRYFLYLSGCDLPDASLAYDIEKDNLTLFIPPVDPESVIWSGLPVSQEEALSLYNVDEVRLTTEVNSYLSSADTLIYVIKDQISDHVSLESLRTDDILVKEAIEECRVIKDDYEVAMIRHANDISAQAHVAVMKQAKHASNERELYALFLQTCIANGLPEQAYHGIFASGTNAATLHYVHNNQNLEGRQNLLLDAAGEYRAYAADITRTFPINGIFSKESREIYDIVLRMQEECMAMLRAGVVWEDVHAHAHAVAIEGLLKLGLLKNGTPQEIFHARTSVNFFPHGLGHYLGMDTHDTGGHANYADKDPMFKYLRVRGTLPAGSVITVEPGIYFCRFIVEPALKDSVHSKYIDKEVLEKYWDVGGVRIEGKKMILQSFVLC